MQLTPSYDAFRDAFEAGQNQVVTMGCYGIGVSRVVAATIEQHHDEAGICWPAAITSANPMSPGLKGTPVRMTDIDIARAFNVKGGARIELKRMLREMQDAGDLKKGGRRRYRGDGALPPVAMLSVTGQTRDGDLTARPQVWEDDIEPMETKFTRKQQKNIAAAQRWLEGK